jgi:hypothetical protein
MQRAKNFLKKDEDTGINGTVTALRAVVPWSVYPSPKRHVSQPDGKPSCPIMATKLKKSKRGMGEITGLTPTLDIPKAVWAKRPRNRGATEGDIC